MSLSTAVEKASANMNASSSQAQRPLPYIRDWLLRLVTETMRSLFMSPDLLQSWKKANRSCSQRWTLKKHVT